MVKTKRSKFMLTSLDSFSAGLLRGEFLNYYKNQMINSGGNVFGANEPGHPKRLQSAIPVLGNKSYL